MGHGASTSSATSLSAGTRQLLLDVGYTEEEIHAFDDPQYQILGVSAMEHAALVSFYESTNGQGWRDATHWCSEHPISTWKGVRVEHGHVTEINLYQNNVNGTFPNAFYKLPKLRLLELGQNRVHGTLSDHINRWVSLRVLAMNSNQLTGSIPHAIADIRTLDEVLVQDNQLTGCIPTSLLSRQGISMATTGNQLCANDEVSLDTPQWEWYLMERSKILALDRIPSHETAKAKGLLSRMSCVFKPYENWAFENCDGAISRNEIVLFSHRWDTPSLDPTVSHPDRPDNSKLAHIKAYLLANPHIRLAFLDYWSMSQSPAAWAPPHVVAVMAIKSLPFYVHCAGNFLCLARDDGNLQDYLGRAWCQLEVLCCNCPYQEFTLRRYDGARWTGGLGTGKYIPMPAERMVSMWNDGNRTQFSLEEMLSAATQGSIPNPAEGALTCERDRIQIAKVCLRVAHAMIDAHKATQQNHGDTSKMDAMLPAVHALQAKLQTMIDAHH